MKILNTEYDDGLIIVTIILALFVVFVGIFVN